MNFKLLDGQSLYASESNSLEWAVGLYYLMTGTGDRPREIGFDVAWKNRCGAYFFLPASQPISDPAEFVEAFQKLLQNRTAQSQWLAWIPSATPKNGTLADARLLPMTKPVGQDGGGRVLATSLLNFGNLQFAIQSQTFVAADTLTTAPSIYLTPNPIAGGTLALRRTDGSRVLDLPEDGRFDVPLTTASLGAWQFGMSPNRGAFYQLFDPNDFSAAASAEVRMTYESAGIAESLRYPALLGALADPRNPLTARLPLKTSLDLLNPVDSQRTRMALDLSAYVSGGPELPLSFSLRTTAGRQVRLKPIESAGFGLARRPGPDANAWLYLTPAGLFEAQSYPEMVHAAAEPIAKNAMLVMCGLSGVEFLLAAEQDRIEFLGEYAANAPAFGASVPSSATGLDNRYSTAWVRLIPGPRSGETFKGFIKQSYCVQAPEAVYFQRGGNSEFPFPMALGARLGNLADTAKTPIFPMAPYGWVYYSDQDQEIANPNPKASGDLLARFEQQAIGIQRRASVHVDQCLGPLFFDMVNLETLNGGYVQTSRGLLVELNDGPFEGDEPAGSWKRLILARSPEDPAQLVQFRASTDAATHRCSTSQTPFNVVSPLLSSALMSGAPFLVATVPQPLGTFDDRVQMGEYPFVLSVNGAETGPSLGKNTVLIFKLASERSLKDYTADPESWTDADVFVDKGTATRLSAQIGTFIKEAKTLSDQAKNQGSYDYFADFLATVESKTWNGALVLNPPLDLRKLPVDIQALLGGMKPDKPLRGHHFGIALNQIRQDAAGAKDVPLDRSSLFGLVHYDEDFVNPATDFDFQVLKLNTLFRNSTLVHFDSRVAWSAKKLFGDPAKMVEGGPNDKLETNTIVIDGALQAHDGKTSIVFSTDETRLFEFGPGAQRVIDTLAVFSAALQPIDAQTSGGKTIVQSAFVYNGSIGFNLRNVPAPDPPADLFSFELDTEDPTSGMQYSEYDFRMKTTITDQSGTLAPIQVDLASLQVAVSETEPRPSSLCATLPLKLVKFRENVSAVGGGSRQVTGVSAGLDNVTALRYAFEMQLVMGTLGALSSQSPLQGALLLGWNPGDTSPDTAGMIFNPPDELANAGGFKIQGVFSTQYGKVKLNRPKLTDKEGSIYVYTLSLTPVDFSIIGLPLVLAAIRSITFFADFESVGSSDGTNLAWFVGEPLQDASPSLALEAPSSRSEIRTFASAKRELPGLAVAANGPSLAFVPLVGVIAGLKPFIDPQATQVIGDAIDILNTIPINTHTTLNDIYNGTAELPVSYDPAAGVTVWVDVEFANILTFKALFSDPAIYGARLEIGSAPDGAVGLRKALGGLVVEIAYRRISDELGAWSAFVTLPDKFRVIKFSEQMTLYLPSVGVIIYTNGDWRVDVGWPFSRDTALRLDFQVGIFPFTAGIGFYLAKLRSADDPDTLGTEFAVIWRFGVGLMFGLAKEFEKGPLSLAAGIYAFVTFEGFLASKRGELTQYGVDYHWFAGQLGVVVYAWGEVDFKIISASVYLEAQIVVGMAVETSHRTVLVITATFTVELSVKLLFFRITFSFTATFKIADWSFGNSSLPVARTDGPTPTAVPMLAAATESYERKELYGRVLLRTSQARAAAAQTEIKLYLTLQTTAIAAGETSAPQAVVSLLVELLPDNSAIDDFAKVVQGVADWLHQEFAGEVPLADQLKRILTAIDSGAFEGRLIDCLSSTFKFRLLPVSTNLKLKDAAIFPVLPELQLNYNGQSIPFDEPAVPSDYAHNLSTYFSQLATRVGTRNNKSLAALVEAGVPQSPAGIVFGDVFNVLGKQLVSQMQELADADPNMTFEGALANLGPAGYKNIAGAVTRYAQYGLRLPTPDSQPFGKELAAMFVLTRQQQALAQNEGQWNTTFELSYGTANVKNWIVFGNGAGTSITETMDPNLVLTEKIDSSWLTKGGGFRALNPIRPAQLEYYLGDRRSWQQADGRKVQLRPFTGALQDYLTQHAPLIATVQLVDPKNVSAGLPAVGATESASPALFIGLQLRQILDQAGVPLKGVYQLAGTDDFTRNQIEDILMTAVNKVKLQFLAPLGNSAYRSSVKDATIVLAKTNLSTLTQPPSFRIAAAAEAPPSSAKLSDVANFLWLIWEVSVVHSGGYYLYVDDLPADAFQGGRADIAVLVTFGASLPKPTLERYQNMFVFDKVPDPQKTVSVGISDAAANPVETYQQNYDAGSVGFEILWPNAPVESELNEKSTPEQKAAFLTALYSILQYRVASVQAGSAPLKNAPALPSHWSIPIGPRGDSNWTFSQTLAVWKFLGEDNRFAPIGTQVVFDVTLLDVFGNALPTLHEVGLEVVYNDPLAPLGEWPWMGGTYSFHKDVDNKALLTVLLRLSPTLAEGGDPEVLKQTIEDVRQKYLLIGNQLADPNTSASIGSTLFADALTSDRTGQSVISVLAGYVNGKILPYIESLRTIPHPFPDPPAPLAVEFTVDRAYVTTIATDIFELSVVTNIWRKKEAVKPDIQKNLPSVQSVSSPLAAMVNPAKEGARLESPNGSDDSTLRAFAKEFESAWAGFDGRPSSTALLKVCEGAQAAGGSPAQSNRQLWVVRVGKGAGIAAEFPNSASPAPLDALPVYFSVIPLSTQLVTGTFKVREYSESGIQDQDRTFSNIDLDVWARAFLSAYEGVLSPEMSTATATLDPAIYAAYLALKGELAKGIILGLQAVLEIPKQNPDPKPARDRFFQALLNSLTADYTVASVVDIGARVSVARRDNKTTPPNLYGDVSVGTIKQNQAVSLTPAKLATIPGRVDMPYIVSTSQPANQAFLDISPTYEIGFIEHDFQPGRQRFGYVPSSWITFIDPLFDPADGAPLSPPMGRNQIPIPLRVYPNLPALPAQQAITADKPPTIDQALQWEYRLNIVEQSSPQDSLIFRLIFNEPPKSKQVARQASERTLFASGLGADPPRPDPVNLFEALARFTFEYPQIAPTLAKVPLAAFAGQDVAVARMALERFRYLIRGVNQTWAAWNSRPDSSRSLTRATAIGAGALISENWIYTVEFKEMPNLVVTRAIENSATLPPWPTIEGFQSPTSSAATGKYVPSPNATAASSGTKIRVPGLFLVTRESVRADAHVERNSNLVPDDAPPGTKVTRAFVYTTPTVELTDPAVPLQEVRDSIVLAPASTLTQAIADLFQPFITAPGSGPQDKVEELRFEIGIFYRYQIAQGDEADQSLFTKIPAFLVQEDASVGTQRSPGTRPLEEIQEELVSSLVTWSKVLQPSSENASLELEFTLFSLASAERLPFAAFRSLVIPIPENDSGWWA